MIAQVARWGNSLALRIPNALAQTLSVKEGRSVELRVEDGRLIVLPIDEKPTYRLENLLDGMNTDAVQDEPFSGSPAGNELF